MASRKKKSRRGAGGGADDHGAQAVRDSAQKIWLAGLGAFERARTDGPKMFESLVEQGRNMGARAIGAADEALKNMRHAGYSGGRWDKLEQVFEERVSKSLHRLGVITSREVEELSRQVRELNDNVRDLMGGEKPRGKRTSSSRGGGKAASGTRRKAASGAKRKSASGTRRKSASSAKRKAPARAKKSGKAATGA